MTIVGNNKVIVTFVDLIEFFELVAFNGVLPNMTWVGSIICTHIFPRVYFISQTGKKTTALTFAIKKQLLKMSITGKSFLDTVELFEIVFIQCIKQVAF